MVATHLPERTSSSTIFPIYVVINIVLATSVTSSGIRASIVICQWGQLLWEHLVVDQKKSTMAENQNEAAVNMDNKTKDAGFF